MTAVGGSWIFGSGKCRVQSGKCGGADTGVATAFGGARLFCRVADVRDVCGGMPCLQASEWRNVNVSAQRHSRATEDNIMERALLGTAELDEELFAAGRGDGDWRLQVVE